MDAQKVRVDNEFAEGKPFKLFILKDKWDETKQILSRRVNVKTGMDDNAGDVGKIEDIDALNALEDLAGHKPTIKPSRVEGQAMSVPTMPTTPTATLNGQQSKGRSRKREGRESKATEIQNVKQRKTQRDVRLFLF